MRDTFTKDADRMARFEREALVMELVEGETLGDRALPIIHQLIEALEYADEKGIVHRDPASSAISGRSG